MSKIGIRIFIIGLLLAGLMPAQASSEKTKNRSITQLEQRRIEIDSELDRLPRYSLRSGIGAIGYRSNPHKTAEANEWVDIELSNEFPINSIALIPNISRNADEGYQSDGFPQAFRIIIFNDQNPEGIIAAEYDFPQAHARIAPLVIPIPETTASRIRIEATLLSTRAFDKMYIFQLAEVMVFSENENVALRRPVKCSSISRDKAGAWDHRFLVDGCTPYLMCSARKNGTKAYISKLDKRPDLMIDLETSQPISRIQLHAVDQGDTVPQAYAGDLGIPTHLTIEGSQHADFSDAIPLLTYKQKSINETGPILMWNIPETSCRYVRLTALDPTSKRARIGFAEIELFSNGKNVARGKPVYIDPEFEEFRPLAALTDGRNRYGKIIPIRGWIKKLALRHELEMERPKIEAELNHLYARQKAKLRYVSWLAALLLTAFAIAIPTEQNLHQRKLDRIKERFAADLHDELGANLHTIGLLSDLADEAKENPQELSEYLRRIRTVTERSGTAVRYVTDLHEADELFTGLRVDMKRAAERIVAQLEHDIRLEGEQYLPQVHLRTRIDLFLFYKECLINICRHSGATQLSTHLRVTPKELYLAITDNGCGLPESTANKIPNSLKRRARLLGAHVTIESPTSGGTEITLRFRPRRLLRRSKHKDLKLEPLAPA